MILVYFKGIFALIMYMLFFAELDQNCFNFDNQITLRLTDFLASKKPQFNQNQHKSTQNSDIFSRQNKAYFEITNVVNLGKMYTMSLMIFLAVVSEYF